LFSGWFIFLSNFFGICVFPIYFEDMLSGVANDFDHSGVGRIDLIRQRGTAHPQYIYVQWATSVAEAVCKNRKSGHFQAGIIIGRQMAL